MAAPALELDIADETVLAEVAGELLLGLRGTEYVALRGPLGAGKTAFARALLRAAGHQGPVRSPTFTLLEPYRLQAISALHMDLYRLADADELEMLGVRDRFGDSLLLIEWPERGAGWLPEPDLELQFAFAEPGRRLRLSASTPAGAAVMARVSERLQTKAKTGRESVKE